MKNLWIIVGSLTLLGGIGLLLSRREAVTIGFARSSANDAGISSQVANLRREVAALRERPQLQPSTIALAGDSEREAPLPALATPAPELTFEQKAERFEQQVEAMAFALDQRLATEGRDPLWSDASLRQIDTSIKARVPGASLLESSCSATVCRATVQQGSAEAQGELSNAIAESEPFNQGTFYHYDRSVTPPRTTLYVVRAGHNLADLTGVEISATAAN